MLCHPIDPHIISDSPFSPTVYWINKLSLTPDDHDILQEGRQLNDKIIAAVGMILESQFPELPHFQLTLYSQAVENLHPAEEGSLFFHNFSNHWAVSHLIQKRVHLFDSLQPKKIAPELQKQLAALYGHLADEKSSEFVYLQFKFRREPLTVDVLQWLLLSPFSSGMTLPLSCTTRKRCEGIYKNAS